MNCEEYYERECLLRQHFEYDEKTKEWVPIDKEAARKTLEREARQKEHVDVLADRQFLVDNFIEAAECRIFTRDFKNCEEERKTSPVVAQQIHNRLNRERVRFCKELIKKAR